MTRLVLPIGAGHWHDQGVSTIPDEFEGIVAETDWGDVIIVPCSMPDSPSERWDMPTAMFCRTHMRTVYYCDEMALLWCDGGPPRYRWHGFSLKALPHDTSGVRDVEGDL